MISRKLRWHSPIFISVYEKGKFLATSSKLLTLRRKSMELFWVVERSDTSCLVGDVLKLSEMERRQAHSLRQILSPLLIVIE